jgi:ABC-2 type transport system permease protein
LRRRGEGPVKARVLWRLVAANVQMTIEYRGAFIVYMLNTVLAPVVSLLVWLAVSEQGVRLPLQRDQLVTYYVLLSVVSMLTSSWLAMYLAENIRRGWISPWLLRPAPYILSDMGNNIGEKIIKLPLLLPMVAVVALLFRDDVRPPSDPRAWLLFALCLPMTATVSFLLDFLTGSLAFWIQDVAGLIRVKTLVGAFLAGQFVPLALFPAGLAPLIELQPFRYTLSFPLEVLTGSVSGAGLARGFALQAAYCALFYALYRVQWRYGLRAYAASGA